MNHIPCPPRARHRSAVAAACTLLALAACSTVDSPSDEKLEYRRAAVRTKPLEVPPDLTQLARESRYQPVAGVVSAAAAASGAAAAPAGAAAAGTGPVAVRRAGDVRIERQGQHRWLVTSQTPEQLWPQLRAFWEKTGFTINVDNPQAGVMETNFSENRAKLPNDIVRNTLGRLVGNLFDTGERDLFRTRLERGEQGTEIYVSHRGIEEVSQGPFNDQTRWRPRASDPELEAEILSRLMLALGTADSAGAAAVATAAGTAASGPAATPPAPPARARLLADAGRLAMEIDDPFDRAWRRVGLTLDRGGFTVEDRDRSAGTYFVRYVDPKSAGQEEENFFTRLFSGKTASTAPVRYRIVLKGTGAKTTLEVQSSEGKPETGENGRNIIERLVRELR